MSGEDPLSLLKAAKPRPAVPAVGGCPAGATITPANAGGGAKSTMFTDSLFDLDDVLGDKPGAGHQLFGTTTTHPADAKTADYLFATAAPTTGSANSLFGAPVGMTTTAPVAGASAPAVASNLGSATGAGAGLKPLFPAGGSSSSSTGRNANKNASISSSLFGDFDVDFGLPTSSLPAPPPVPHNPSNSSSDNFLDSFDFLDPPPPAVPALQSPSTTTLGGAPGAECGTVKHANTSKNPLFNAGGGSSSSTANLLASDGRAAIGSSTTAAAPRLGEPGGAPGAPLFAGKGPTAGPGRVPGGGGHHHKSGSRGMFGGLTSLASSVMRQGEKMLQQAAAAMPENEFEQPSGVAGAGFGPDAALPSGAAPPASGSGGGMFGGTAAALPAQQGGAPSGETSFLASGSAFLMNKGPVATSLGGPAAGGLVYEPPEDLFELPDAYRFWRPTVAWSGDAHDSPASRTADGLRRKAASGTAAKSWTATDPLVSLLAGEQILFEVPRGGATPAPGAATNIAASSTPLQHVDPSGGIKMVVPTVFPCPYPCKKLTVTNYRLHMQLNVDSNLLFSDGHWIFCSGAGRGPAQHAGADSSAEGAVAASGAGPVPPIPDEFTASVQDETALRGVTASSSPSNALTSTSSASSSSSLPAWLHEAGLLSIPWGAVLSIKQYDSSGYKEILKDISTMMGGFSDTSGLSAPGHTFSKAQLATDGGGCWKIATKDLRAFYLEDVPPQFGAQLQEAFRKFANAAYGPASLFAFAHCNGGLGATAGGTSIGDGATKDGWHLYDPLAEYGRMGIDMTEGPGDSPWRLSSVNKSYQLCESYPQWLVVPKRVSDPVLLAVSNYRKKKRIPSLSWCGGPALHYACVFRSSQPCDGLWGNSSEADERLLREIATGKQNGLSKPLFVLDLRTHKSALGNKAGGGGYEDYSFCQLEFAGIPNIHAVRDSYEKMEKAVCRIAYNQAGSWYTDVGNSLWFENLSLILQAAANVAWKMRQNRACLVHCSDGWDRTAQNTTLAMLSLDPFYRTIEGFCVLIQKEWCSYGHQFKTRLATSQKATGEYSPVFFQWLDCVYQFAVLQHPERFEFNEQLLLDLTTFAVSNQFGTFLADNESECCSRYLTKTKSVWTHVLENKTRYRNPRFRAKISPHGVNIGEDAGATTPPSLMAAPPSATSRTLSVTIDYLPIQFSQARLKLWEKFWLRYHPHLWLMDRST
ncbi:unnamed protein product [Amoebophrya sp. A120]|nr:unnamed protein product [Amoebophrya sp. A120]|eukprot:GSA120T00016790001.1